MNDNAKPVPNLAAQQAGRIVRVGCVVHSLLFFVTGLAIRYFSDWSIGRSILAAICAYWFSLNVPFIIGWLRVRSGAGRLLLDCSERPYKHKSPLLLNAAVWGLAAVLSTVAIVVAAFLGKKDLLTYILFAVLFASFASYFLIRAFTIRRIQICENGIVASIRLLEWDGIESYDWQGEEEPKLVLKIRRRFFRRFPLSLPLEHRDAVDELLRPYVRVQHDDFEDRSFGGI